MFCKLYTMKSIYSIFADILLFLIFVCILIIPSLTLLNLTPAVSSKKMRGEIAGVVDTQAQPLAQNATVFDKINISNDVVYSENLILLTSNIENDFTKEYTYKIIQLNSLDNETVKIGSYYSTSNKTGIINVKVSPPELSKQLLIQIQTDKYLKEFTTEKSETSLEISPSERSDIYLKITSLQDIRDLNFTINIY